MRPNRCKRARGTAGAETRQCKARMTRRQADPSGVKHAAASYSFSNPFRTFALPWMSSTPKNNG